MPSVKTATSGFRTLIVWQEAKKLTCTIYKITKNFPEEERFHLVPQMRRAATSSMANLAEGSAMKTASHRNSYYTRAKGSVIEVDNFAELALELEYIAPEDYEMIIDHCGRLAYLIEKLIKSSPPDLKTY